MADRVLFLTAVLVGIFSVEPEGGGLEVLESNFLLIVFVEDLPILSDGVLPLLSNEELEVVGSVFAAGKERLEDDLEDCVGLGTKPCDSPKPVILDPGAPLPT